MPHRLGLIGCGWVSAFYGRAVAAMPDRLAWAWAADEDPAKAAAFCAKYGGQPLASHINAPQADAYVVATPHHLHMSNYLDLAPRGRPVLVEKPLGLSLDDCDRMLAARDKHRSPIMVGYVNRHRPAHRLFKESLDSGRIGTPLFADYTQLGNQEGYAGGWLLKKATLGGGCFFSSCGHLIDLGLWYHGPMRRLRVETGHYRLPMEGEDNALAIARFENGLTATFRESWCARGAQAWQRFTVFGSTGSMELTYHPRGPVPTWHECLWDARLVLRREGAPEELLYEDASLFEFRGQFEAFADLIETGRPALTSPESAREVIRLVREAEADLARLA
ncbi:MAG: Gfo/Idh/MocA family oxidoreductase [Planctomycetota bacterium]|nr:Gfo/Idh/MocA family oxidoreductase [Planctomycetota bacterium]